MIRILTTVAILITSSQLVAQDAADLAKQLSNPIASLVSVPLQNNSDFGIGALEGSRNTLNIQPVVPVSISEKWSLINRVVMPVISQYSVTAPGEKQGGLGDFVLSGFLSPKESKLTWGVGPVFLLPLGSEDFSSDQFGIGPTAVALTQTGGWTIGGLINDIIGLGGDDKAEIHQMFVQPFVVYNWPSGAGLGANLEWTQNWETSDATVWLNPTISGVTSLGKQKVQLVLGPRINIAAPDGAKANFGVRGVLVFLFPK